MRAKFIKEGVGDKYLYNNYNIKNDDDEFEKLYKNKIANKVEKCIGAFKDWDGHEVNVYLNPTSLKSFGNWNRACSDADGNLYLADSIEILHSELASFLYKKRVKGMLIDWQQYRSSNVFYLAEGYDLNEVGVEDSMSEKEKELVMKNSPAVINKHPQFKFRTDMTILSANDKTQLMN